MTKEDPKTWITYVAVYEDGSIDHYQIDKWALRRGDHVLKIVAGEWQSEGKLKPGKIVRVFPDPCLIGPDNDA